MTKLGYLMFFIILSMVFSVINVLLLSKEVNQELFYRTLFVASFSIVFIYIVQRFKKNKVT